MNFLPILLIGLVVIASSNVGTNGNEIVIPSTKPTTTAPQTTNATTTTATETTTTSNLTTTAAPETTTTSNLTTTTSAQTTNATTTTSPQTTNATTTTSPQTTNATTTAAPETTTTSNATTTVKPTLPPTPKPHLPSKPTTGHWNFTDASTNETCILLKGGFRFTFRFQDKVQQVDLDTSAVVDTTSSNCSVHEGDKFSQIISLKATHAASLTMSFRFESTDARKSYALISIVGTFGEGKQVFVATTKMPKVRVGGSFQCLAADNITSITNHSNVTLISIETDDLQYEAFRRTTNGQFSAATSCAADVVISNIVPIAVGAALAILVIVVLVAYLIGRRRSRNGYEQV